MSSKILIKRGLSANLTTGTLDTGELGFTTDTSKLYIGNNSANILVNPVEEIPGLNTTTPYTKLTVNKYGQVTQQENLTNSDIPTQLNANYYFQDTSPLDVPANSLITFNNNNSQSGFIINSSGYVFVNQTGVYLINYFATTTTSELNLCLVNSSDVEIPGSRTTNVATGSTYLSCSASVIITLALNASIAVKNVGTSSISIPSNQAGITLVKM